MLDLQKLSAVADYFVICTGESDRQLKAIVDSIDETIGREFGRDAKNVAMSPHAELFVYLAREIQLLDGVNLGIAAQTDRGLVVPAVRERRPVGAERVTLRGRRVGDGRVRRRDVFGAAPRHEPIGIEEERTPM